MGIAMLIRSSMMALSDMADDADNSSEDYQNVKDALREWSIFYVIRSKVWTT